MKKFYFIVTILFLFSASPLYGFYGYRICVAPDSAGGPCQQWKTYNLVEQRDLNKSIGNATNKLNAKIRKLEEKIDGNLDELTKLLNSIKEDLKKELLEELKEKCKCE